MNSLLVEECLHAQCFPFDMKELQVTTQQSNLNMKDEEIKRNCIHSPVSHKKR